MAARRRKVTTARRRTVDSSPTEPSLPREAVTRHRIVRWSRIGRALTALAATTSAEPAHWAALTRVARALLEPILLLEHLTSLAGRRDQGPDARAEFTSALRRAARMVGTVPDDRRPLPPPHAQMPCDCRADDEGAVRKVPLLPSGDGELALGTGVIDESALAELLVSAARAALEARPGPDVAIFTGTVMALALDAQLLNRIVQAFEDGGREGLLVSLEHARLANAFAGIAGASPAPMRTRMGGAPMPSMPSMPSLPTGVSLPPMPGMPGTPGIEIPDLPGPELEDAIRDFIDGLRRPEKWDPDRYDHAYPFWRDPLEYIDAREIAAIRCALEVYRLLQLLSEPPPTRPAVVVWSAGISSISLSGPCAGDTITIVGAGFGAMQPPQVALLLPTLDGCRVVTPTSWSDTRIEAVLPVRVASGPVGFGDAVYIAAYDAWAARMNDLERQLARLKCAPRGRSLVAPFGECPPSVGINIIAAGVPEIHAFTANFQDELPLEPGQPFTLRWHVVNATAVQIERLSFGGPAFTGPSFGGAATLTPAATQTVYAFGPQFHNGAGEWQYRLTASGACGPAVIRTVRIFLVKRPSIRIERIEVTQSIQTSDHAVRLVTGKPTVVRALVANGLAGWNGGVVNNVQGRVRMLRNGVWSGWVDAANNTNPLQPSLGTSIAVGPAPTLNDTNDALNFILPSIWCSGTARYQVEVFVNGASSWGPFPGFSERVSAWTPVVTFETRRTLQFRYVRVDWNGTGAPTHQVCRNTLIGAVPLLPTPAAGIAPVPGQGIHTRSSTTLAQENDQRRDMLNDFEDEHNCSWWEAATEWLGSDCPDDDGAIWVLIPSTFRRGEAFDTPSNVCYTPPSNGPYAAHEIAHCLNQAHVRLPTGPNGPTGGDAASAWPNNGLLVDVPFDVSGTPGTTQPRALSLTATNGGGTGVGDLMTYWGTQNGTWPMPRRWQQLWDFIGA